MTGLFNFVESANLTKVQILNALELKRLKEIVFVKKERNEDKKLSDIKDYFQESKVAKGNIERRYSLIDNRFKPNGNGLSILPSGLRNYIFDEYEFWEVRNLSLFIVMKLAQRLYDADMKHSDAYLKYITGISNSDINKIINEDDILVSKDKKAIELSEEIYKIKKALFDDLPEQFSGIEFSDSAENEASNNLLDIIGFLKKEDIFATIVSEFSQDKILGFTKNGFAVMNRTDTDLKLNNIYGFKYWKQNKDSINTMKLENEDNVGLGFDTDESYAKKKEEFEKSHFIVLDPLLFCRIEKNTKGKNEVVTYSKGEFRDIVAPEKFIEQTDKGPKEREFFSRWIQDGDRRQYRKFVFEPNYEFESDTEFNLFQGFDFDTYKTRPFKHQQSILDSFLQLFKNITNDNEESCNYLMDYFAHIIQRPNTRNSKIILMQSEPGIGKDLIFSIMQKLMGTCFHCQTEDLTKAFGTFNGEMEKMLTFVCNETDAKKGFMHKEQLKAHATNEYTTINQKNKKPYKVKNYSRTFICTNHLNAVDLPYNDRRYVVFEGTKRKIPESEFASLYELIQSDTKKTRYGLYTIFKWLDTRDISNFNPRNAPITDAYTQMKNRNVSPFYEFLYDCIVEGELRFYFARGSFDEHKKSKNIRATTSSIIDAFNRWLHRTRTKCDDMHSKRVKTLLNSISVTAKSHRLHGEHAVRAYEFKLEELEETLKKMINRDEDTEEDYDDWENDTSGYEDHFY